MGIRPLVPGIMPLCSMLLEDAEGGGALMQVGVHSLSMVVQLGPGSVSDFSCL